MEPFPAAPPAPTSNQPATVSAFDLQAFLNSSELGQFYEAFIAQRLTPVMLPLMTNEDLAAVGITLVGDRFRFRLGLQKLLTANRSRVVEQPPLKVARGHLSSPSSAAISEWELNVIHPGIGPFLVYPREEPNLLTSIEPLARFHATKVPPSLACRKIF
jgi:hypothetical protein